jgi:hypothetical protein
MPQFGWFGTGKITGEVLELASGPAYVQKGLDNSVFEAGFGGGVSIAYYNSGRSDRFYPSDSYDYSRCNETTYKNGTTCFSAPVPMALGYLNYDNRKLAVRTRAQFTSVNRYSYLLNGIYCGQFDYEASAQVALLSNTAVGITAGPMIKRHFGAGGVFQFNFGPSKIFGAVGYDLEAVKGSALNTNIGYRFQF